MNDDAAPVNRVHTRQLGHRLHETEHRLAIHNREQRAIVQQTNLLRLVCRTTLITLADEMATRRHAIRPRYVAVGVHMERMVSIHQPRRRHRHIQVPVVHLHELNCACHRRRVRQRRLQNAHAGVRICTTTRNVSTATTRASPPVPPHGLTCGNMVAQKQGCDSGQHHRRRQAVVGW